MGDVKQNAIIALSATVLEQEQEIDRLTIELKETREAFAVMTIDHIRLITALEEIRATYFEGNDAECADTMYNIAVKVTDKDHK